MSYPSNPAGSQPSTTSGKAKASLVLGVLSFFTCLLTGIPAIILGVLGLSNISKSQRRLTGQGLAIFGIVLGVMGTLATPLVFMVVAIAIPAVHLARETARENTAAHNLIQVSRAMMNAENTEGRFPSDYVDPQGKPLLSWRVRLLPHLDQRALYDQFRLNEPWDSPHNLKLAQTIPAVYTLPDLQLGDKTLCQLPVGEGTLFESYAPTASPRYAPVTLHSIRDPMSQTILLVETDPGEAVTWTKPQDFHVDRNNPWRGLGDLRMYGFLAVFADGHFQKLSKDVSAEALKKAFSRDGDKFKEGPLTDAELNPVRPSTPMQRMPVGNRGF